MAMTTLDAILLALATYRVATDLAWEDGPVELYSRLRSAVYTRFGDRHWASEGVSCPICLSFWIAPLLLFVAWPWLPWLVSWLAVAGAAALLARRPR